MKRSAIALFVAFALVLSIASLQAAKPHPVGGHRTPTQTPALPPAEAAKHFIVPDGFQMRLFASEPEVINPVAMTWDDRGRLWVVELFEYPLGAPKGAKPRDTVKILEDTDNDGRADKVTVFADGLNLATGVLCANGGAYIGQAPHLYFMKDTDGDDVADVKEIVKTGFGLEDRHELLNGFTWGPDGYLYMTHGVFTHSKVRDPNDPDDDGVVANAAVARFHPGTGKFEVFADGTSNPWGVDFDRYGNAFISACVIDHLFHMAPGGQYLRQGGLWANPYGYASMHSKRGGIPSIVDHRHHLAAYSGVQIYQGDQYPEDYQGAIMMGNIHDKTVHMDRLKRNGSSFIASFDKDFVRSEDGWFRPVAQHVGPDGALWIMDWYDKYPCYQNARADPEGVDRTHGRIWRAVYVGGNQDKKVPSRSSRNLNLAKAGSSELVGLLAHKNVWHREMAQRLLNERRDQSTKPALLKLLAQGATLEGRLHALWTLHGSGLLDEPTLDRYAADNEWPIRMWVARLSGERGNASQRVLDRLLGLASDEDASVRLAVATAARQFVSSELTVNRPVADKLKDADTGEILVALIENSSDGKDPLIPFLIWTASEPTVARDPSPALEWLAEDGPANMPLSGHLATKLMRRICDTQNREFLDQAVAFLNGAVDADKTLALAALDGLLEGQRGKAIMPTIDTAGFLAKLRGTNDDQLKQRAQRLGALWGDAAAIAASMELARNSKAPAAERIRAIQTIRKQRNENSRKAMIGLIAGKTPEPVKLAAIQALGEINVEPIVKPLLAQWQGMTAAERRATAEMLVSRARWQSAFLSVLEQKQIAPGDVPPTAIRTLFKSDADFGMLARRAELVFGKFRDTGADKAKIIEQKKRMILSMKKQPDLKKGHELAKAACLTCHKLHGEGADIGPDLTGVGRSSLEALLSNIIDPNQIIGAGYENVEVMTKDGRTVAGRMVEKSDSRVRLLAIGPVEHIIARSDIEKLTVSQVSVMPEGLDNLPDEDFRNLVAYILNPPQDNAPFSWKVERPLAAVQPKQDGHDRVHWPSVIHWNPEWRIVAPEFEGTPRRFVDFAGQRNALMTHPYDQSKPAALERKVKIPNEHGVKLTFKVAAHEKGDWELRALANGQAIHRQVITAKGERWKTISLDLAAYAGKEVELRREDHANNWSWEFAYRSDIRLTTAKQAKAN